MSRTSRGLAFAVSLAAFAVVAALLRSGPEDSSADGPILVYCGAGIRPPVEAAARTYARGVQLSYGGSQTLLVTAEVSRRGDLFIPGDDGFLETARRKGLVDEVLPLARMHPVLAVAKGNPRRIRALEDLGKGEVRLALPDPEVTAAGKLVRKSLEKAGRWEIVKGHAAVSKPTVSEVANDLKLGTVDAGFLWDATVRQYPELEGVELPELLGVTATISAGVLRSSLRPQAALRFARFLASSDRGAPEFSKTGYEPAGGDPWEERPALTLFSGAMLRPAIERTIRDFEQREGCDVTRVYNGCGILVAQMKGGARPDLYFACDESFMREVQDRFSESRAVSTNQLVILVAKGNPHRIRSLKDLAQAGLRVGVGNEKQCALGAITQATLVQEKLRDPVMKNVVTLSPTGDLLVNQMRAGALDAVVAYLSNATGSGEVLEAVRVDLPCALATQPVAVEKSSPHRQLASRLVEKLVSDPSRELFLSEGFGWKASP
jgi:molybdenum ABC transporter molybdate-binding protein